MTRRQNNNQWSGGIAAHPVPKYSECKIRWKDSSLAFRDQDILLLIDYVPKGQTTSINAEYYSSLLVQLKDILKDKRRGKVTKDVLFLHDNTPLTGLLQPRRNWPTWASSFLITHPILRIWPRRTTTCSLD